LGFLFVVEPSLFVRIKQIKDPKCGSIRGIYLQQY